MNRMRLRIAERLKQSQNTAASLTTFNEVDMYSLMEFRKLYKDEVLKKTGVKLGFMSAFARACVLAAKEVPAVNASIEGPNGGDTIVYRDYVDISVAVATEKGLVTPVVRNAESQDLIGIEASIAALGKKARDNKLTIEDMAGGTFTISNVRVVHHFSLESFADSLRAASLVRLWAHPSSICHKLLCLGSTPSRTSQSLSMAR
jgi:2-oxoglutarate dehydrogenase E2 component (dihydrolipoamide succinyltransferase)